MDESEPAQPRGAHSRIACVSAKTARKEFLQRDFPLGGKRLDIPGMTTLNVQRRSSHLDNTILSNVIDRNGIEIDQTHRGSRRIGSRCRCVFPDEVTAIFRMTSRFAAGATSLTGRNDEVPVPGAVRMAAIWNSEIVVVMESHEMIDQLFVPVDIGKRKCVSVNNREWSVPQRESQAEASQHRSHHPRCGEAELSKQCRHAATHFKTHTPFSTPERKRSRGSRSTAS